MKLLGGIEAGGTKIVCGIGTEEGTVLDRVSFATKSPEDNLNEIVSYFQDKDIQALGVGSFGPVDPNKASETYGYITSTPKQGWTNYPLLGSLKQHLHIPMEFDTDVNAAALGEATWGAAQGLHNVIYYTVGTGIGAGVMINGGLVHGLLHPEVGHIRIKKHEADAFAGSCPYHLDCLEGLAAGPAIEKRWGYKGIELSDRSEVWELEAYYLAQAVVNSILMISPEKVIMGGGVMKQQQLFPLIHKNVIELLNGYVSHAQILKRIDEYIVPPGLGDDAGLCGALALACRALQA